MRFFIIIDDIMPIISSGFNFKQSTFVYVDTVIIIVVDKTAVIELCFDKRQFYFIHAFVIIRIAYKFKRESV